MSRRRHEIWHGQRGLSLEWSGREVPDVAELTRLLERLAAGLLWRVTVEPIVSAASQRSAGVIGRWFQRREQGAGPPSATELLAQAQRVDEHTATLADVIDVDVPRSICATLS